MRELKNKERSPFQLKSHITALCGCNTILMKQTWYFFPLILLILLACENTDRSDDETLALKVDLSEIGLVKDYGPIAADGCGWIIEIDSSDYQALALPEEYQIDSLYILSVFNPTADTFICFGDAPFPYVEVLHQPEEELVTAYWDQTQCSDPWGQPQTDVKTVVALNAYLANEGIRIYSVLFSEDSELNVFCDACHCGTGKRLTVQLAEADLHAALAIGFRSSDASKACFEESPLESVTWLKELKERFENSGDPAGNRIVQYTYQDQCVFWIDDCYHCADKLIQVHNYAGEVLCEFGGIDGRSTCPGFSEVASHEVILWEQL